MTGSITAKTASGFRMGGRRNLALTNSSGNQILARTARLEGAAARRTPRRGNVAFEHNVVS